MSSGRFNAKMSFRRFSFKFKRFWFRVKVSELNEILVANFFILIVANKIGSF